MALITLAGTPAIQAVRRPPSGNFVGELGAGAILRWARTDTEVTAGPVTEAGDEVKDSMPAGLATMRIAVAEIRADRVYRARARVVATSNDVNLSPGSINLSIQASANDFVNHFTTDPAAVVFNPWTGAALLTPSPRSSELTVLFEASGNALRALPGFDQALNNLVTFRAWVNRGVNLTGANITGPNQQAATLEVFECLP